MGHQSFDRSIEAAEETLIAQGIDPADLAKPAEEKVKLAEDIGDISK